MMELSNTSLFAKRKSFAPVYLCIIVVDCNPRHPSSSCTSSRTNNATTNLLCHVESCEEKKAPNDQAINTCAHSSTYSAGKFWYLIALWVSQYHHPFKIVKDKPLQKMFKMLYAKVEIPLDTTVSRDIKEVHTISKKHVAKALQVCPCHIFFLMLYKWMKS